MDNHSPIPSAKNELFQGTASKPCTLIGHSMSAMIGMLAAKRQPAFFKRIVMIAPAPCYVRHPDYAAGFSQENIDALLDEIGDDYMAWLMAFAPVAVGDPRQQDVIDDFRRSLSAMRPDIALTVARLIFSMDLRPHLDSFGTMTTIIQPTGDPVAPIAIGQYLAQRWPQALARSSPKNSVSLSSSSRMRPLKLS